MIGLFLAGFAALLLCGCSTSKELSSALKDATIGGEISQLNDKLVVKNKTTKKEMLRNLGAPSLVFANEIGGESWVYSRIAVRESNVGLIANGAFATFFPYTSNNASKGGGIAGVDAGIAVSTNRSSYKSAGLLVRFNAQGCVNSYEFNAVSF